MARSPCPDAGSCRATTTRRYTRTSAILTWRGRGPWENYPDRKFAAKLGEWSKNVVQTPPYIRPQDYGHYCDTTSLTLGRLSVKCIFSSTPREGLKDTFGFAAWPGRYTLTVELSAR